MSTIRRFVQAFDLALGRLFALVVAAVGAFCVYLSLDLWSNTATLVTLGIGLGLLLVAGIMLYRRVTFLNVLDFFAIGSWWG